MQAMRAAQRRSINLCEHRARTMEHFAVASGDLLIGMEPEQGRQLAALYARHPEVQVTLLGLWSRPLRPHLHDPKDLLDPYFDTVFGVIDDAIARIRIDLERRDAR